MVCDVVVDGFSVVVCLAVVVCFGLVVFVVTLTVVDSLVVSVTTVFLFLFSQPVAVNMSKPASSNDILLFKIKPPFFGYIKYSMKK